jgi:hypothetical protein
LRTRRLLTGKSWRVPASENLPNPDDEITLPFRIVCSRREESTAPREDRSEREKERGSDRDEE